MYIVKGLYKGWSEDSLSLLRGGGGGERDRQQLGIGELEGGERGEGGRRGDETRRGKEEWRVG